MTSKLRRTKRAFVARTVILAISIFIQMGILTTHDISGQCNKGLFMVAFSVATFLVVTEAIRIILIAKDENKTIQEVILEWI